MSQKNINQSFVLDFSELHASNSNILEHETVTSECAFDESSVYVVKTHEAFARTSKYGSIHSESECIRSTDSSETNTDSDSGDKDRDTSCIAGYEEIYSKVRITNETEQS